MKKRKSTFANFLLNSLSFFDASLAIYERIQKGEKPYSDIKSLEEQKIFNLARSFETLSKAFLATYGTLIIYPALLISVVKKGHVKAPRHFQKIIDSLNILLRQALNREKIIEQLRHDPIGRSEIPALLSATAKLLEQLGEKQLAKIYKSLSEYFGNPANQRSYDKLQELRKRITAAYQLKDAYEQLLNIIEKCVEKRTEDEICRNLPNESKLLLNVYKEKPYLIDQAITMLELGFQELFDSLLYTAYLARAAETADYTIGRVEMDEKYLEEVRDHQSEMIKFMKTMAEVNRELVKSDELDEFMAEVESEARKVLQKETEKEKSNGS
jgi:hemoglobin-like flavoprotein